MWLTRRLPVFGCLLKDVQMPEMDGFECTAIIRDREQVMGFHLPIVRDDRPCDDRPCDDRG